MRETPERRETRNDRLRPSDSRANDHLGELSLFSRRADTWSPTKARRARQRDRFEARATPARRVFVWRDGERAQAGKTNAPYSPTTPDTATEPSSRRSATDVDADVDTTARNEMFEERAMTTRRDVSESQR